MLKIHNRNGIARQAGFDDLNPHIPLLHKTGAVAHVELQFVCGVARPMQAEEKSGHVMGTHRFVKCPFIKVLDDPEIGKIKIAALGRYKHRIGQLVKISFHLIYGVGFHMQIGIHDKNGVGFAQVDAQIP